MTLPSRPTTAQELQGQIKSLSERFSALARSVQDQVVVPLSHGKSPDPATVDDLRSAIAEYQAIEERAASLGLTDENQQGLPGLLRRVCEAIESESWEIVRAAYHSEAERVLRIAHKSGQSPPFLQELHGRARDCVNQLASSTPTAEVTREVWEDRVRPFRDLWVLLNEPDTLSDSQAEEALGRLERDFGRGLVSAITLRRLVIRSDLPLELTTTDSEPRSETTPAAKPALIPASEEAVPQAERATSPETPLLSDERDDQPSARPKPTEHESLPPPVAPSPTPNSDLGPPTVSAFPRRDENQVPPPPPSPEPKVVAEPRVVLDDARCAGLRNRIWGLVTVDRIGLAYQLTRCVESLARPGSIEPAALFRAAALGPSVRSSSGELVDHLRRSMEELQLWSPGWRVAAVESLPARLVVLGLALRPTLLAPAAGALALLEENPTIDSLSKPLGEIRRSIAEFGKLNLELSPSVLKGVCDHAVWQKQVDELREEARAWLESNRVASIIYAPTSDVWHRWLERDWPLGRTLEVIINDQVGRADEVRRIVHDWSVQKNVEKELGRTDEEIRKGQARRRPIEARARTAISSRVQEFVQLAQRWLDLLAAEPRALDDFRQQRADVCRNVVQRALPSACTDVAALANGGGASPALAGAVHYLRKALEDIGHLFDPQRQESTQALPIRVLLAEELLALPDVSLDQDWQPVALDKPEALMARLEAAVAEPYDPERAFTLQSKVQNHLGTLRVIEALEVRPDRQNLVERLRAEREDQVIHCRQSLRRKLDETQRLIEQAVCYDLITDEERARFMGIVEEGRLLMDEVADFATEHRKLDDIDRAITDKREQRVREVNQKLSETTVSGDRQADLEVVRQALARGDFSSADEYIELIRKGQPLVRTVEPARSVLSEFFRRPDISASDPGGFVQRFNTFMEGEGKSRPELREVLECIREGRSVGPIDMRGVPGPQAAEAADMVAAWLRLKNRSMNVAKDLTTLLTAFGLRNVQITLTDSPKSPHWLALCECAPLGDPTVCIIPHFGSQAKGRYRILGIFERPDEEAIVNLVREVREGGASEPIFVLYFGRMTDQRRRDLAELCWQRNRSFLTIDEALVFFLCGGRFSRLPVLFQCALPFTVAEPYTTTASLVPVEMFFGREQERRTVIDPYGTNLVYGGRQLGKSALLRDVQRREHNPTQGRVVRWIDLKNRGIGIDRPTEDLWSVLGQELYDDKVLPRPATTHQSVADRVKDWLKGKDGRRILLLLDEADAFLEADSRAVSEQTRHSFPEVARLKGLMDDTNRRFKVVFAGLHNVQRAARDPNTPVGHLGTPVCIGPLLDNGEWRQARDLIEIPFRHMGYEFQPPDLWMRILSYTNYYPSLVQVFCKHLLEYLHSRDRTTFDFRNCPPYPITAQQIEELYQSEALQGEIRHKFELTLGLDERYRLIALCIALASIEQRQEGALVDGFDVGWVREKALREWPSGFTEDTSFELFRTILDEMIGLGILRRSGPDRYALRSPNVLNLLGSKSQIEQKLFDVSLLPAPPSYEAGSFRRSLYADIWTRSPLTAEQESILIEPVNGVTILYGSPLSGLNDLRAALREIRSQGGVRFADSITQLTPFNEWLREVDKTRSESEGVTLAVVTPEVRWSPAWVIEANEFVRRKTSSTKRFLRVIFVADPEIAWEFSEDGGPLTAGVTELSLKPWREAALWRWMEDAEFGPEAVDNCALILKKTGGWGMLVHALGEACRGRPHNWREKLEEIQASWPNSPRWVECCGMPAAALPALKQMADFDDPLSSADLAEFAPGADVPRVLRWADRFSYVREQEADAWVLDPLVRSMVTATG